MARRNKTDYKSNGKTRIIGVISPSQDFPIFEIFLIFSGLQTIDIT